MIFVIIVVVLLCIIGVLAPMIAISNARKIKEMERIYQEFQSQHSMGHIPSRATLIGTLRNLKSGIVGDKRSIKIADDIYQDALSYTQNL